MKETRFVPSFLRTRYKTIRTIISGRGNNKIEDIPRHESGVELKISGGNDGRKGGGAEGVAKYLRGSLLCIGEVDNAGDPDLREYFPATETKMHGG